MAISALDFVKERQRQQNASDSNFYRKYIYFWELRVPKDKAPGTDGVFYFPMGLNPESYTMTEPFSVEMTPTEGGGLYVEENGIVHRQILLSGQTGFKPRPLLGSSTTSLVADKPVKRSFNRSLPGFVFHNISGQKHFQYLQDAVFRTYADFKRDPATAEDTKLIFHNLRDEESWHVVPQSFKLERNAKDRILYRYEIELLVVDAAKPGKGAELFSPDKNLIDSIKDGIRMVNSGVQMVQGAIQDITAVVAELTNLVKSAGTIIDSVGGIINAAEDFVNGVTDFIETPYAIVESTIGVVEDAMDFVNTLEESGAAIRAIPDNIVQKFRQLGDGLERIGAHPELFAASIQNKLKAIRTRQELLSGITNERRVDALGGSSPSTLDASAALGTALTPGDIISAAAELGVGREVFNYTSAKQIKVGMGDTLANLAARYLGDARLWQHIAVTNGLKPPFITEQANLDLASEDQPFPGALGVGQTILIPSFDTPPSELPLLPVLGVSREESAEVQLLGTDLKLEVVGGTSGNPLYDVPIDTEGGSTGPKLVSGVDNYKQALRSIVSIEQGSDVLYKGIGVSRIIGSNFIPADIEASRYKFIEALTQDPRTSDVRRITFETSGDLLTVEADVKPRGFTEAVNVKAPI